MQLYLPLGFETGADARTVPALRHIPARKIKNYGTDYVFRMLDTSLVTNMLRFVRGAPLGTSKDGNVAVSNERDDSAQCAPSGEFLAFLKSDK